MYEEVTRTQFLERFPYLEIIWPVVAWLLFIFLEWIKSFIEKKRALIPVIGFLFWMFVIFVLNKAKQEIQLNAWEIILYAMLAQLFASLFYKWIKLASWQVQTLKPWFQTEQS